MKMAVLAAVCNRVRKALPKAGLAAIPSIRMGYTAPYFYGSADHPWSGAYIDPESVAIVIFMFEPDSFVPYKVEPYFQPALMSASMNIPGVPDYITWTQPERSKVGFRAIPDTVTDLKLQLAVKAVKYLSFKLSGSIMTETHSKRVIEYYRNFLLSTPLSSESKEFSSRFTSFA
jgi:hypothetical protein